MKLIKFDWAKFAEYCYKDGKDVAWNFDGWLGELVFKEGRDWRNRFYLVKKFINQTSPRKVILDLMCGGAYPSRNMARENDSLFIGIDRDINYLHFAKSKIKDEGVNDKIELIQADVRYLPLKNKSADIAFSIGGPEYLPNNDLKKFLTEIKRVTNRKVILTFTSEKFKRRFYYRTGLYHLRFWLGGIDYHKIYSKEEILDLLSNQGFQNPSLHEVGRYYIVATAELS